MWLVRAQSVGWETLEIACSSTFTSLILLGGGGAVALGIPRFLLPNTKTQLLLRVRSIAEECRNFGTLPMMRDHLCPRKPMPL